MGYFVLVIVVMLLDRKGPITSTIKSTSTKFEDKRGSTYERACFRELLSDILSA